MKGGREHRVPLSEPVLEILWEMEAARLTNDADALAFPGHDPNRPLSDMTLTAVLRPMKRGDLTAHGFRSTFRDWAADTTAYPAELAEMALSHAVGNKVEAAYRRGDLFVSGESDVDFTTSPHLQCPPPFLLPQRFIDAQVDRT